MSSEGCDFFFAQRLVVNANVINQAEKEDLHKAFFRQQTTQ